MKDIILFSRKLPTIGNELVVKPLHLPRDIHIIHQWVNQPRAKQFWQMEGSVENLYRHYEDFLNAGNGYSLMCFLDNKPVAQIDYYKVAADEVKEHFDYKETDFGIHLLMGNYNEPIPHLTRDVMITGLAFLFTLDIARIIGEPDARNDKANKLVVDVGFRFIKTIQMSYKTANLYMFDKTDFNKKYEDPKK
ncbi:MAG TPA: GNAT family N-acetyltransferase [Hanamia sp.]|nr:GNAT family N-acetyltransferase [Hanamia sp.]